MTQMLAIMLMAVLTSIAGMHAYWGIGGRWPGRGEPTLSDIVIGKTPGGRMPPPSACFAVAAAILAGIGLILLVSFVAIPEPWMALAHAGYWVFAVVFVMRGATGYVPAIWRPNAGTAFVRLNTRYYSPLCLLLGAGLIANLAGR